MSTLFLSLISIVLFSCGGSEVPSDSTKAADKREQLINMNRQMLHNESAQINRYIEAHKLVMQTSRSGLRYILERAPQSKTTAESKPPAKTTDDKTKDQQKTVTVIYQLTSLSGSVFYSYTKANPLVFHPGHAEQCKGIEEALEQMKPGDKVTLVIPSHLGYGFNGDGNKIPPRAVMVCQMELIAREL